MTLAGGDTQGFRRLDEELIHQGHIARLVKGFFVAPDGTTFSRDILRHPGAVGIVAINAGEVLLVRQYRPALGRTLLEIPAGTMDKPGELPAATARRELAEEAGATAERLEHLCTYWVAPGVSDEQMHLYLATGLTFGEVATEGPEEQHMTTERVALAEAPALIAAGHIVDAKSIVGLLLAGGRRCS